MDLIGLKELGEAGFQEFLNLADSFVDRGSPALSAKIAAQTSVALVFFEPSTRTRVSFELAAARLGIHTVRVGRQESSARKGESVEETCRNLEAMGLSAVVLRDAGLQTPYQVQARLNIPVINAGNGNGEHPTQALIDALTLRRAFRRRGQALAGKRVAIIGDIAHSRVARSDALALGFLGCQVVLAGPPELMPGAHGAQGHPLRQAEIATSRQEALEGADAVIMLRVQHERLDAAQSTPGLRPGAYLRDWGIDARVARQEMRPDAFILHPGPVIHGMELSAAVADGPRSLILEQVSYGVAVRQAVFVKCLTATRPRVN